MSSAALRLGEHLPPVGRMASVVLREGAFASDGGFEETIYLVRIHDGWMSVEKLLRRGALGGMTARLAVEDDPNEVASGRRHHLKPRVYWKRETEVEAPVGTRFIKQVWTPNRERAQQNPLLPSVPYNRHETELVIRPDGRLVSAKALAPQTQRRAREVTPGEKPMTRDELSRNAAALLAALGHPR